jgi:rare lipoprotein A
MKQQFFSGLTTTALTTVLGTTMFLPNCLAESFTTDSNSQTTAGVVTTAPAAAPINPQATQKLPAAKSTILAQTANKGGRASWYGPGFHGKRTANGERFNQNDLTAAHRHLPFGTKVKVTNVHNGRSVVVRINDRGPFSRGRVIDLSKAAARLIGVFQSGSAPVLLEVLGR